MSKLIILGLLKNKHMHGYEIQTIIQESRVDQWANVLSGSIYYALNKLETDGSIETVREERTGARVRKIYGITKKGEEEYIELLKENLKAHPHSLKSDFMLSLAMVEKLPKQEAQVILSENLNELQEMMKNWLKGKENKANSEAYNPVMAYAFENTLEIIKADMALIEKVINYLESK